MKHPWYIPEYVGWTGKEEATMKKKAQKLYHCKRHPKCKFTATSPMGIRAHYISTDAFKPAEVHRKRLAEATTSLRTYPPKDWDAHELSEARATQAARTQAQLWEDAKKQPETFLEWLERYTLLTVAINECVDAMKAMCDLKAAMQGDEAHDEIA